MVKRTEKKRIVPLEGQTTKVGNYGAKVKLDEPKIRERFLSACRLDVTVEACCAYAGITKQTYYGYIKAHPEFLDEVEEARQEPYLLAVSTVVKNMKNDANLALRYLERKRKDEFSLRQELTGRNGTALYADLSDDELAHLEALDTIPKDEAEE